LHGDYIRRQQTSFYMHGGNDSDGDFLPDHWEKANGLDPESPDLTSADPDGDGLFHFVEFQNGTHPLDPDSDNGGENDGSEMQRGTNPVANSADDGVAPPEVAGWAGAGQLWLRLTIEEGYDHLRVLRSKGPNGPWTVVANNLRPTTEYHDGQLQNNTEYCYRVIAVSAGGARSGTTNQTCVTPRLDPIAPEGRVSISSFAGQTVRIKLEASDAVQDAHYLDEGDPPVHEGAQSSGVSEMMLSNRADFEGAVWEPYRRNKLWKLQPDGGVATVYVKYRDRAGNESEVSSDSIVLSSTQPSPALRP
jgi:hypothetical protein